MWLSLPLLHEDEATAARLAAAAKAKKAKKSASAKEQFDIEREMKEGEATVDRIELAKNQADTFHAVTLAYFRILKSVSSKVGDDDKSVVVHSIWRTYPVTMCTPWPCQVFTPDSS